MTTCFKVASTICEINVSLATTHYAVTCSKASTVSWTVVFLARLRFQTIMKEGIKGIYKGMGAPLATVAVFNAVLFASRGQMEVLLSHTDGKQLHGNLRSAAVVQPLPASQLVVLP